MSASDQQRIVSAAKVRQAQFKNAPMLISVCHGRHGGVGPSLHRNNTALKATPTSTACLLTYATYLEC